MPPHAAHLSGGAATVRLIMLASVAKSADVMHHAECAIEDRANCKITIPSCSPAPDEGLDHVKSSSPSPTRFTRKTIAFGTLD